MCNPTGGKTMKINKLILAAALACACVGTTMARPGHGPGPRGPHRGPVPVMRGPHHGPHHGPGFHRPPPPSLHGWHRGPRPHHLYRSCWYGGVWYDAYGYPYTSTAVVVPATTTTVPLRRLFPPRQWFPPRLRQLWHLRLLPRQWFTDRLSKSGSRPGRHSPFWAEVHTKEREREIKR